MFVLYRLFAPKCRPFGSKNYCVDKLVPRCYRDEEIRTWHRVFYGMAWFESFNYSMGYDAWVDPLCLNELCQYVCL